MICFIFFLGNPDVKKDFFLYEKEGPPFDVQADENVEEDIMANGENSNLPNLSDDDSDEDVPDELKRDFVDEQTGEIPQQVVKKKSLEYGRVR